MADKLNRRIEVHIMRTVNIGNYESVKGGITLSQSIPDKADLDKEYNALWEAAEKQLDDYLAAFEGETSDTEVDEQPLEDEIDPPEDTVEEDAPDPEEPDSGTEEVPEEEEGEELDLTEEEVNKMTKPELVELCKTTEGMEDIDLNLNVKPLRAVIIDLIFEEEEADPEDDNGTEDGTDEESTEEGTDELDETGGDWDADDWQDQE